MAKCPSCGSEVGSCCKRCKICGKLFCAYCERSTNVCPKCGAGYDDLDVHHEL